MRKWRIWTFPHSWWSSPSSRLRWKVSIGSAEVVGAETTVEVSTVAEMLVSKVALLDFLLSSTWERGTSTIYLDVGPINGIFISTCSLSFPPASLSLHALFPTLRRHGYRLLRQRLDFSTPSRVVLRVWLRRSALVPRVDTTVPVGIHSVVDHTLLVYVAKLAARECWFFRCLCCDVQAVDLLTVFAPEHAVHVRVKVEGPSRVVTTVFWL